MCGGRRSRRRNSSSALTGTDRFTASFSRRPKTLLQTMSWPPTSSCSCARGGLNERGELPFLLPHAAEDLAVGRLLVLLRQMTMKAGLPRTMILLSATGMPYGSDGQPDKGRSPRPGAVMRRDSPTHVTSRRSPERRRSALCSRPEALLRTIQSFSLCIPVVSSAVRRKQA